MPSTLRSASLRVVVCLLLSYAVVISFSTPLLTRQVIAAPSAANGLSKGRWTPLLTPSLPQSSGQRSGELLIRFRPGAAQQSRDNVLASHGARRMRQLRGESGVEKLEVLGGQNPETVAQLMRLQPEVEFAGAEFPH
ncbi:MAG: S8 family serine peptidase [Pyrinomonadaceae bacterium]